MTAPTTLGVGAATTPAADGALTVGEHWTGFGGAHGGLLIAAAARSMARLVPDGRPLRAVHAALQGSVAPGTLQFTPTLDRNGRGVSFARVEGAQDSRRRLTASAVFGDSAAGIEYSPATRGVTPQVPGPADCAPYILRGIDVMPTLEFRPACVPVPLAGHSRAELYVWIRVVDDPAPVDAARALILLDAPAPGLFATLTAPIPVPTVELSAHLLPALARTLSPWALVRMQTVIATDGYAIDDSELWGEEGELLATARQLRRVLVD